ncbi:MAG TPA: site-specific DNA-methyltransferase [Methylocella sp.]|nr:site-specific DNA-methyltransferase [Methylocella sp.]
MKHFGKSDDLRNRIFAARGVVQSWILIRQKIAVGFIWGILFHAGIGLDREKSGGEPPSRGALPAAPLRQIQVGGDPDAGNLLVQGDNLEALKALLPYYAGKVKCIYIDPPYNTGNEAWVYNDNVNSPEIKAWLGKVVGKEAEDLSRHDKWLCMIYPRLRLLKEFLTEDGGIFVSLDDGEVGRFRLVADEIFGTRNFVSQCVWHKKYTRANDATHFSDNHDHVVMYAKDKSRLIIHRLERTEKQDRAYSNPNKHPKGPWKPTPLHAKSGEDEFFTYTFSNGVKWSPPEGTFPRFSPHTLKKLDDANEIWFGGEGGAVPQRMSFLSEVSDGLVPVTLWPYSEVGHNHEANDELKEIGLSGRFQNPKPIRLVERCLELMCNNDDVIMDCFAGSGTTGHAALKFSKRTESNIRFILVETIASVATTITSERLARAQFLGIRLRSLRSKDYGKRRSPFVI